MQLFWSVGACLEIILALVVMPVLGWRWLLFFSSLPVLLFLTLSKVSDLILYMCSVLNMNDYFYKVHIALIWIEYIFRLAFCFFQSFLGFLFSFIHSLESLITWFQPLFCWIITFLGRRSLFAMRKKHLVIKAGEKTNKVIRLSFSSVCESIQDIADRSRCLQL